jgi:microcystin-dependent protein
MKKFLAIALFLFISLTTLAQGIAVQGIARDNNNSGILDTNLTFTFSITKNDNTVQYSETQSIRTDNFGVFSHIVSTGNPTTGAFNNVDFSITNLKLKVIVNYNASEIEVYNQTFQYTPYSHFAKNAANAANAANGAPVGSIMPYTGSTAPAGWVLCDGGSLEAISGAEALIALVGVNAPNLQGMFLRGTGESPVNQQFGPSLLGTQGDAGKDHEHYLSLSTTTAGLHNHDNGAAGEYRHLLKVDGYSTAIGTDNDFGYNQPNISNAEAMANSGNHQHVVSGNTHGVQGFGAESRPVSYGVNYIIKL